MKRLATVVAAIAFASAPAHAAESMTTKAIAAEFNSIQKDLKPRYEAAGAALTAGDAVAYCREVQAIQPMAVRARTLLATILTRSREGGVEDTALAPYRTHMLTYDSIARTYTQVRAERCPAPGRLAVLTTTETDLATETEVVLAGFISGEDEVAAAVERFNAADQAGDKGAACREGHSVIRNQALVVSHARRLIAVNEAVGTDAEHMKAAMPGIRGDLDTFRARIDPVCTDAGLAAFDLESVEMFQSSDERLERIKAENTVFSMLFDAYPDVRAKAGAELKTIVTLYPPADFEAAFRASMQTLLSDYYDPHYLTTSDAAIDAYLRQMARVITSLNDDPLACLAYYQPGSALPDRLLQAELVLADAEIKAGILRASLDRPQPLAAPLTKDQIAERLAASYGRLRYKLDDLGRLNQIAELAPADGCRVATQYMTALASGTPAENAVLFKSILHLNARGS